MNNLTHKMLPVGIMKLNLKYLDFDSRSAPPTAASRIHVFNFVFVGFKFKTIGIHFKAMMFGVVPGSSEFYFSRVKLQKAPHRKSDVN